jgi:hypothetical protein
MRSRRQALHWADALTVLRAPGGGGVVGKKAKVNQSVGSDGLGCSQEIADTRIPWAAPESGPLASVRRDPCQWARSPEEPAPPLPPRQLTKKLLDKVKSSPSKTGTMAISSCSPMQARASDGGSVGLATAARTTRPL